MMFHVLSLALLSVASAQTATIEQTGTSGVAGTPDGIMQYTNNYKQRFSITGPVGSVSTY